jgi:hypothetical protein
MSLINFYVGKSKAFRTLKGHQLEPFDWQIILDSLKGRNELSLYAVDGPAKGPFNARSGAIINARVADEGSDKRRDHPHMKGYLKWQTLRATPSSVRAANLR